MERYFPLFVSLKDKKAVIIGGGAVAYRRAAALIDFKIKIKVVAPEFCTDMIKLADKEKVELIQRKYQKGDLDGAYIAVAASSDRQVNRQTGRDANGLGVFVSVADCKEESSFYFPGLIHTDSLVVGVSSGGEHPSLVKAFVRRLKDWLHKEEIE